MKFLNNINIKSHLLPSVKSEELFMFIVILIFSTVFWFVSVLNDNQEIEVGVPLKLTGVPENVIITDELPDSVTFTLRAKGFTLCWNWDRITSPLEVSFKNASESNGTGKVTPSELQKLMLARVGESIHVTSVKAKNWDFAYNHGAHKKVPIVLDTHLSTAKNFYIALLSTTPDSAVVYANKNVLDTIHSVKSTHQHFEELNRSFSQNISLVNIKGVKIVPQKIKMDVICEQLTEVIVNVPIRVVNVPLNMAVKTFPSRVDIRVAVGVKQTSVAKPENFSVIGDYNDLKDSINRSKLPIRIATQSKGIVSAHLKLNSVDYLIESMR